MRTLAASVRLYLPIAKINRIDGGGELISTAVKDFCQSERGITIGYAAPYVREENDIAEQC